jgi:Lar family restriction alleviation protein
MTTAISPAVTIDSHSAPLPCSLCGGMMTAQDDIDVCVCGSRRVRSQPSVSNVVTTTKLASGGPTTAKIADGPSSTEAKAAAATGIRPCPFCGGTTTKVYPYDEHCREFSVDCWECELHGPYGPNESAAIVLWNSRPQAAASRDDVLLAAYAELLHILHEMTDVGNDWCAGKLAVFERVLGQG